MAPIKMIEKDFKNFLKRSHYASGILSPDTKTAFSMLNSSTLKMVKNCPQDPPGKRTKSKPRLKRSYGRSTAYLLGGWGNPDR
jgi:hypothetical protein